MHKQNDMKHLSTVLVCGMYLAGCAGDDRTRHPEAAPPVAVSTIVLAPSPMAPTFDAGGAVRARTVAVLSSRIVSPIAEIVVKPGDRVRRGQPLVRLDARQLDSATFSADATLASMLQAARSAEAEEAAAQSALSLATLTHGRVAGLRERNSATQAELDAAVAGLRAAQARVSAAQARRAEAAASIDASRGNARSATIGASYAVITAPFDGIITETPAQRGAMAAPGVGLVTIEDTRGYRLEVSVDAARVGAVTPGIHVPVLLADAVRPLDGIVAEVVESVDAASHTFVVKIDLPVPPKPRGGQAGEGGPATPGLRSGLFGRARLPETPRPTLTVPSSAVVHHGQLAMVFTEESGTARMRVVRLGEEVNGRTPILAGLVDGDRVIINPPPALADGTRVTSTAKPAAGDR
jgi:RND family efflux transporter MFP subunit